MQDVIPDNAKWIKQSVAEIDPENNLVSLENGEKVSVKLLLSTAVLRNVKLLFVQKMSSCYYNVYHLTWRTFPWYDASLVFALNFLEFVNCIKQS